MKFDRAALRGATFREAFVERGEFAMADLRDIDLRRAHVRTTDFGGADLTGASFSDTVLEDVDLSTAIDLAREAIAGARLTNVQLPSFD